ncbi:hypothetical protein B0H67DRAFT_554521 [Lasiosphaeris hirsuta]|uniref:Uncharacterized protein n=1 Tax=Lasiosphaeris hirsuta TaxID=260670 RepID=A0AA40AHX4_9PEZI|nr:hypothetical protein B0H67DRAFT_554521 [Lasiosphaeris hirsuta]
MAPEQRPPHANLADYARKLQAEHDAEYLAKWEVIKTLSEALDQGFAKIPKGEHHVRWGRETLLGIKEVIYQTVGTAKTPTPSGSTTSPNPTPYVGIDNGSIQTPPPEAYVAPTPKNDRASCSTNPPLPTGTAPSLAQSTNKTT